jgi:predicted NACHT family NTPase
VVEQLLREKLPHSFEEIIDTIMLEAWKHLESPGVLDAFAKATLSRLRHFDPIFGSDISASFELEFRKDHEKRRRVLEAIVPMFSRPEEPAALVFSRPRLVISEDFPWMIERLSCAEPEIDQLKWAQLIERGFDPDDAGQTDAILSACQGSPILAKVFEWRLRPVELNSPQAQKMKESYTRGQELLKQNQERPLLQPPPAERIAALLDECETGNHVAWWRLSMEMTLQPQSTNYRGEDIFEPDLTTLPGWEAADGTTRTRIMEAAKKYILHHDPETAKWLGSDTVHLPAFAGYKGLRLILKEEPSFIFAISPDVWKRWASIILAYPTSVGTGDERPDCELVKLAYQHAPGEIIETLSTVPTFPLIIPGNPLTV